MRELWTLTQGRRRTLGAGLAITLIGSLCALAQPLAVETVLSTLSQERPIRVPLIVLGLLIVASSSAIGLATWMLTAEGESVVLEVRRRIAHRLPRLRVKVLDREKPGDLTTRATSDSQLLQAAATTGLVQIADGTITVAATFALMFYLSATLAATTIGVMIVVAVIVAVILPRIREATLQAQDAIGQVGSVLERSLGAARMIKAYGAEARVSDSIDQASVAAWRAGRRGAFYAALLAVVSELALQAAFLIVLGVGGALAATGSLPVATLIAFLLAVFWLTAPLGSLLTGFTALQDGQAALDRIKRVLDLPAERPDRQDTHFTPPTRNQPRRSAAELAITDLAFGHEQTPLFEHITFDVAPGRLVALTGPTGVGKSTLLALVARFYEPWSGSIAIDGQDISGLPLHDVRAQLAWVDQNAEVIDGTVAENLSLGGPGVGEEAMISTLDRVALPQLGQDLHRQLGARGSRLSGGQRQRLATARALLRQPRLLLLDAVTSHLDAETERNIGTVIGALRGSTTIVMVSHRSSTVAAADAAFALHPGGIRRVR